MIENSLLLSQHVYLMSAGVRTGSRRADGAAISVQRVQSMYAVCRHPVFSNATL